MSRLAPLLLALVLLPSSALAGPWSKEFGQLYAKVGADLYYTRDYDDARQGAGIGPDGAGIQDLLSTQISFYAEVGVLPVWPLQLSVSLPLSIGRTTFTDPTLIGEDEIGIATGVRLGDLRVALQSQILRKGFQLAGSVELKVPLYSNDKVGQGLGPYRDWFAIPGDGQLDITPMVLMGGSIPTPVPMWIEGGVGYRFRTEAFVGWTTDIEFVDGIPFYATWGLAPGPVWITLRADGIKNIKDDETTREFVTIGPGVGITVWKGLAIEFRVAGDVVAKNAPQGVSGGFGVSWRMPYPGQE